MWGLAALLGGGATAARAAADDARAPALERALEAARQGRLGLDPGWLRLGHYRRRLLRSPRSEAADAQFFLSPRGRTDPQAELEADLRAFWDPVDVSTPDAHAQCQFPLRFSWLKEKLGLGGGSLPSPPCAQLNDWIAALAVSRVGLVFASGYLNNPSTLYGHTFLKTARRDAANATLDYVVNFAADTQGESNAVLYMLKGLAGMFPGTFSALPYYLKIREYADMESRDLWEYDLPLSDSERRTLLLHVWELGRAEFPYLFFTKNCSYQLLPLLEVARPSLSASGRFPTWVIPIDTVRLLSQSFGPLPARYRPSIRSQAAGLRARLSAPEARVAGDLVRGGVAQGLAAEAGLNPARRAAVLDASAAYLDYLSYRGGKTEDLAGRRDSILAERASLGSAAPPPDAPAPTNPVDGHSSMRLALGGGFLRKTSFEDVSLRFALHDLLDDPAGYLPDSKLEMGDLDARRDDSDGRVYVNRFDLFSVMALNPWDGWAPRPSWELSTGFDRAEYLSADAPQKGYWGLSGGVGLSWAFRPADRVRLLAYGFAESDNGAGPAFVDSYRIGGGGKAGLLAELGERWRVKLEAQDSAYFLGDARPDWLARAEVSFKIDRNDALRLAAEERGLHREIGLRYCRYLDGFW